MKLQEIAERIKSCTRCPLSKTRTHAVPGEGPHAARRMLIGEAPGKDEDLQGRPFVGRSGGLLTELLENSSIGRKNVFITSVIKCRPPGNRSPKKAEILACSSYLEKQITAIKPEIIVPLGNTALKNLLGLTGITRLKGKLIEEDSRKYFPTFHPAAAIRNGNLKPEIAVDFDRLKYLLDGE